MLGLYRIPNEYGNLGRKLEKRIRLRYDHFEQNGRPGKTWKEHIYGEMVSRRRGREMDRRSMEVESDIRTCDDFSDLMFDVFLINSGLKVLKVWIPIKSSQEVISTHY